jgi:hypothetical protein
MRAEAGPCPVTTDDHTKASVTGLEEVEEVATRALGCTVPTEQVVSREVIGHLGHQVVLHDAGVVQGGFEARALDGVQVSCHRFQRTHNLIGQGREVAQVRVLELAGRRLRIHVQGAAQGSLAFTRLDGDAHQGSQLQVVDAGPQVFGVGA